MDLSFYKNKSVLVTGHTGFKGAWLCNILNMAGAKVTGYALEPPTYHNLFSITNIESEIYSIIGDIRNLDNLQRVFKEVNPEIVFHLAAQPLVRESYREPVLTYETNVMGTVNILECIRKSESVISFLNITTDKVYKNREWEWGYRENDPLDGLDPYSNSKSCSELVTHSYNDSFFNKTNIAVSTARAGNVIGGGDFAKDRIIPDCIRAAYEKEPISVRNRHSIRPYQHVLEPLSAYLLIAKEQSKNNEQSGYYNVGPKDEDCIRTGKLVDLFCKYWGEGQAWFTKPIKGPHEANFLKLDCSKVKVMFDWEPYWDIEKAIEKTVIWTKEYFAGSNMGKITYQQIEDYFSNIGY